MPVFVLCLMLGLTLLAAGIPAVAAIEAYDFHNEQQERQFQSLTHTLRCPKCQNNSIADSNAALAQDLRQKVYDMTIDGKSQQEIIDYMTARYGNFVTYNPPFIWSTAILWLAPLMIILVGLIFMFRRTNRLSQSSAQVEDSWGEEQESRLQSLLADDEQEEDKQ